jgi:hypothetical protein
MLHRIEMHELGIANRYLSFDPLGVSLATEISECAGLVVRVLDHYLVHSAFGIEEHQ